MNGSTALRAPVVAAFLGLFVGGCLDALVGAECAEATAVCDGTCVDTDSDPSNCGACGITCQSGACVAGACVDSDDPGSNATDSDTDETTACGLDISCDGTCVDPGTDPMHCGGCGIECSADESCSNGHCCPAETMACDGLCVSVADDPDNCGGCGIRCPSGLCDQGACVAAELGHLVVIGHDYTVSRVGMNRIVGNAVFAHGNDVEVVVWEGRATEASINGTDHAIDQVAAATGRTWDRVAAGTVEALDALLADADVFLLYAQHGGTDAELDALGAELAPTLDAFLVSGGVVVILDGSSLHSGTYRVANAAGLLSIPGRSVLDQPILTVADPSDLVAVGVPNAYRGERTTVSYDYPDTDAVVVAPTGPVVLHLVYD